MSMETNRCKRARENYGGSNKKNGRAMTLFYQMVFGDCLEVVESNWLATVDS